MGYIFNSYQIYIPSLVSQLISEFQKFYKPGQNLNLSIEEFLILKVIKVYH
jgi:hypothetical protein